MPVCANCGGPISTRRSTKRFCSGRCRAAAHRRTTALPPSGADQQRTLRMAADARAAPLRSEAPPAPIARAVGGVVELGRLAGDTISDRLWRILLEPSGFTLQCQALVPGGWMNVHRDRTIEDLRPFAAWCGLTIGAVEIAAEAPELVAA